MQTVNSVSIVEHPFSSVKSQFNLSQLPFSDSMIHHKSSPNTLPRILISHSTLSRRPYGVSRSRRILSPQLLTKKYNLVLDCLKNRLGLTTAQREVVLRLLRYWAYYGYVYPKEATVTEEPGCSKATFWRTIKLLKSAGLIITINRYVFRPHAQISNLYRFDKLLVLIARYLAEHGSWAWGNWLKPLVILPAAQFMESILPASKERESPLVFL